MKLLEVEKFVAKCGILGYALKKMPKDLLKEIPNSNKIEIVAHSDNLRIPDSMLYNIPSVKIFKLDDIYIDDYSEYDVRIKIGYWRAIIFDNLKVHSGKLAHFISILMQNPDGMAIKVIKERIPGLDKKFAMWLDILKKKRIVFFERTKDEEHVKFNFEIIDKNQAAEIELDESQAAKTNDNFDNIESSKKTKSSSQSSKKKNSNNDHSSKNTKSNSDKIESSQKTPEDYVQKIIELLKKYKDGLKDTSIYKILKIDTSLVPEIIKLLEKNPDLEIKVNDKISPPVTRIRYIGSLDTNILGSNIVSFVVDMCRSSRIIILSDLPKEIKNMKVTHGIDDLKFLEILEDNGFGVIEVRSKFVNSEFVAFSDTVETDDPLLLETIEKAKNKVQKYFRTKVKYTFFKNMYFCSLDNNYSPYLKERALYFYKFVSERMKSCDEFFCFNIESLYSMNFFTFAKCVPLRGEFQFIKIIDEIRKVNKNTDFISFLGIDECVEDFVDVEFERINDACIEVAKRFTLGDILNLLQKNSENFKSLQSRLNIYEFDRILQFFINENIFEGFSDDQYLYFEKIEGMDNYIEKIELISTNESMNEDVCFVSYPTRIKFYDMICDIPQDIFPIKAYDIVNDNFDGDARNFFLKKLQAFK